MDRNAIVQTFSRFNRIAPPVLMYSELTRMTPCIFLYEGHGKIGHWCAILRHDDGWEIFDSVGFYPDSEIDNPRLLKVRKKLWDFAVATKQLVEYNDFPLQKGGRDCGLWCIMRWFYSNLSCDEFEHYFKEWTDVDICAYFGRLDLLK